MKNWWKNRKRRVAEEKLFAAFATYERFAQGLASTSDVDVAVRLCSEARDIYVTLGDRGREARAWNVHGGLHRCNRRWPEAIASEQRAFEIAMSLEPTSESVGQGLNNLADLSREAYLPEPLFDEATLDFFVHALQYAVQACEHFRRYHPTSRWFGMSMYHLGRILGEFGDIDAASNAIAVAVERFTIACDPERAAHCVGSQGVLDENDRQRADAKRQLGEYLLKEREDWSAVNQTLAIARRIAAEERAV